ncbi:MAG TPA: hypothetical protein VM688_07530 [Nocardioidaceae bacterium]|nr:hypothetical protein [Nocardioidaceae bacterium]
MSEKSERRQARQTVAAYHEAKLSELVTHVAVEIDRFRDGDLDVFDVDRVLFQYSRAARELWKYCNLGNVEVTARYVLEAPAIDWWERGAPRSDERGCVIPRVDRPSTFTEAADERLSAQSPPPKSQIAA